MSGKVSHVSLRAPDKTKQRSWLDRLVVVHVAGGKDGKQAEGGAQVIVCRVY